MHGNHRCHARHTLEKPAGNSWPIFSLHHVSLVLLRSTKILCHVSARKEKKKLGSIFSRFCAKDRLLQTTFSKIFAQHSEIFSPLHRRGHHAYQYIPFLHRTNHRLRQNTGTPPSHTHTHPSPRYLRISSATHGGVFCGSRWRAGLLQQPSRGGDAGGRPRGSGHGFLDSAKRPRDDGRRGRGGRSGKHEGLAETWVAHAEQVLSSEQGESVAGGEGCA